MSVPVPAGVDEVADGGDEVDPVGQVAKDCGEPSTRD
jgi:hypothetical protein